MNHSINELFAWVWRRRLIDPWTQTPCRVVRVTGWRSCLLDTPSGQRARVTFLWRLALRE